MGNMTISQLRRATAEQQQMEVYERHSKNFRDFEIVGITVRRKGSQSSSDNIVLMKGSGCSGTGTINSFSFSDALGKYLTGHLMGWFGDHIQDAKKALRECGVRIEED